MKILRSAIVGAAAASSILMATTPASAQTAGAFEGQAHIGCFGCGIYGPGGNGADFQVAGTINGNTGTGTGWASFTVNEPPGAGCIISGSADGEIHVTVDGTAGSATYDSTFAWGRVGAVAVITVTGDINGTATAAFKVTNPVGNPCGQAVDAQFAGAIAG